MKKALTVFVAAAMVSVMMASNAFAYIGWVRDTRFTPERWWYSTQDNFGDWYRGETGKVKWAWIDSNHDGLEECYCFGDDGWIKAQRSLHSHPDVGRYSLAESFECGCRDSIRSAPPAGFCNP